MYVCVCKISHTLPTNTIANFGVPAHITTDKATQTC